MSDKQNFKRSALEPCTPSGCKFIPVSVAQSYNPSGWESSLLQVVPPSPLPPAFRQANLTVHQFPSVLLGEERHCES